MQRSLITFLFTTLLFSSCSTSAEILPTATSLPTPTEEQQATPSQATGGAGWQLLDLNEILQQPQGGIKYTEYLDRSTMSLGLYDLPPGAIDPHTPHRLDEVIYVVQGEADLRLGDEVFPVGPGSVAYVRAGVSHSFENIRSYIRSLVLFSKVPSNEDNDPWTLSNLEEVLERRSASSNVWEQFVTQSTLRFGMYMLPERLDGDSPLTHTFDEINIVVNGSGVFRIEQEDIAIGSGSIMFVEAGLAHSFHSLEEDIDVLIFWDGN